MKGDDTFRSSRRGFLKTAAAVGLLGGSIDTVTAADTYDYADAANDAFWYSRFNADALMHSANGMQYPRSGGQAAKFEDLRDVMRDTAGLAERPVRGLDRLTILPLDAGDPAYAERPVFEPRPVQETLRWKNPTDHLVVTPQSIAWPGLSCVQWSKAAEGIDHRSTAKAAFDAQLFGFASQWAANLGYLEAGFGVLRDEGREEEEGEGELYLFTEYDPESGEGTKGDEETDDPLDYAATLWLFSELADFAGQDFFGYSHPEVVVEAEDVRRVADMTARTVFASDDPEFSADEVRQKNGIRGLGVMLSAVATYGGLTADGDAKDAAARYAEDAAGLIIDRMDEDGRVVARGDHHQAAIQGAVAQGLLRANAALDSTPQSVAADVVEFALDELWHPTNGTFDDERGNRTISLTARDLGDIVGGLNLADAVLDLSETRDVFARFFNDTVNRSRLQRAERSVSRDPEADFPLPLPASAGDGTFGEAPVLNAAVEYDRSADEWAVTDSSYDAEAATYATAQLVWAGRFNDQNFPTRGLPR